MFSWRPDAFAYKQINFLIPQEKRFSFLKKCSKYCPRLDIKGSQRKKLMKILVKKYLNNSVKIINFDSWLSLKTCPKSKFILFIAIINL